MVHTEKIRPAISRPNPVRRVNFGWLAHAAKLPGRTLQVACAIYFVASVHGTPSIRLAPYALRMFGVSRDSCYDSLRRLAAAELIVLSTHRGRLPRLTIVDRQARPLSID
jgi:hypothetical protein